MTGAFAKHVLNASANRILTHFTELIVLTWDFAELCNIFCKLKSVFPFFKKGFYAKAKTYSHSLNYTCFQNH